MRRSRKLASILTVGILALSAAACGDDSDSGSDNGDGGDGGSAGSDIKVGLAYDIVTQGHHGSLTVESREGEGSTFRLSLPAS